MDEGAEQAEWKDRYREVVGELTVTEQNLEALRDLFGRAVTRLSMAAMGRDLELDEQLTRVRALLDSDADLATLRGEIDSLASALLELDRSDAIAVPPPDGGVSTDAVANCVERVATIPALEASLGDLRGRIEAGIDDAEWAAVLDRLADAVAGTVVSIHAEKADLEGFLATVTEQLAEFETFTEWQSGEARDSRESSRGLEETVQREMRDLSAEFDDTAATYDLKGRVQTRLDAVGRRLREFREREEARIQRIESRNTELAGRVRALDASTRQLKKLYREQRGRLLTDTLTGIHSRYAYEQRVDEELNRALRHDQPLCYVLWDIDHFKVVNDSFGHRAGDRALKVIARLLASGTRREDFVARLGGEEFVMLLPLTTLGQAAELADKLRQNVHSTGFRYRGEPHVITVSGGVTVAGEGDTAESLYERADAALYRAKADGRDCVVTA
ncbi:MAG: GGDEF domain-containing protein [Pseudomonadota bacterium]